MQESYTDEFKIEKLIEVIRHYNKWPTSAELKLYGKEHYHFPSHNTINSLGGSVNVRVLKVRDFCLNNPDEYEERLAEFFNHSLRS